jgi:hypothetical protein
MKKKTYISYLFIILLHNNIGIYLCIIVIYDACSLPHLPICLSHSARLPLTCSLLNAPRLADQASFSPLTSSGLPRRTWRFPQYLSALIWPSRH